MCNENYCKCRLEIFLKTFLLYLRLNVFVPWNEVVVLDPVKLSTKGAHSTSTGIGGGMGIAGGGVLVPDILAPRKFCADHDYDTMKPLVLATWKHNFQVKNCNR